MQRVKRTNKTTHRSEWRSVLKKSLTEPALLEMSGYPTYQELAEQLVSGSLVIGGFSNSNRSFGSRKKKERKKERKTEKN
jgi:hypothetical protein